MQEIQEEPTPLSTHHVALLIGISTTTVRNWAKAGHLTPISQSPLCFSRQETLRVKRNIGSGLLMRLRNRANKTGSESSVLPKEYEKHHHSLSMVETIADQFRREDLDLSATMYFASLRQLELRGEVMRTSFDASLNFNSFSYRRKSVRRELASWSATISRKNRNAYRSIYSSLNTSGEGDFLGLLYQGLINIGSKSSSGSYYTPSNIIEESLKQRPFQPHSFLDPCCGTGNYLLSAARMLKLSPGQIHGFDSDALAVRIARINLLLAFPHYDSELHLHHLNALTDLTTVKSPRDTNHLQGRIDFIATNPPWGAHKNTASARQHSELKTNEVFSQFLAKSLTLLRKNGFLSFVLPESILKIRTHRDIRKLILNRARMVRITNLGRPFSGVFTPAIRLDLLKGKAAPDWVVCIVDRTGKAHHVLQDRFCSNEHFGFDVEVDEETDRLLKKLYAIDHFTLAGNADWALGIVTGNNKLHVAQSRGKGMETVFRGSDIRPFKLSAPCSFLRFEPGAFQQVAKDSLYRAPEKLIYKFISNKLAFAYDDKQRITLNSANILIPRLPGLSIKVALALLNSKVFQYIFQKKFSTHKVLRGDLEKLPFPKLSPGACAKLTLLTDAIHAGEDRIDELQDHIFSLFCLTKEEAQLIRNTS